jgi:hypothetical protein
MVESIFPTTPRDSQDITSKRFKSLPEREVKLSKRQRELPAITPKNTETTSSVSTSKATWITLTRPTKISSPSNSANGQPTSPKLRLPMLKLFTKKFTLKSERTPTDPRLKRKPQSERSLPSKTVKEFSKTPREANGSDNSNLPRNKERLELLPRSRRLFRRNEMVENITH